MKWLLLHLSNDYEVTIITKHDQQTLICFPSLCFSSSKAVLAKSSENNKRAPVNRT